MSPATSTSIEWHDCECVPRLAWGWQVGALFRRQGMRGRDSGVWLVLFPSEYLCLCLPSLAALSPQTYILFPLLPILFPFTITSKGTSTSHAGLSFLSPFFHLQISQTLKPSGSNTMCFQVEKKVLPTPHPQVGVLC